MRAVLIFFRRVSAIWASRDRAGWQQVETSRSRSSPMILASRLGAEHVMGSLMSISLLGGHRAPLCFGTENEDHVLSHFPYPITSGPGRLSYPYDD